MIPKSTGSMKSERAIEERAVQRLGKVVGEVVVNVEVFCAAI